MFDEAIEVFETVLKKKSEQWLYDEYIPSPGTYILLNLDDNFSVRAIFDIGKPDKKTGDIMGENNKDYGFVSFLDKNSRLITMNKAVDTGKIIHSNNFYSFFVKKESFITGKLEEKNIEGYYSILANPYKKYKKSQAKQIYSETEKILGSADTGMLDKIQGWVQKNLRDFIRENEINLESKDYLKIFFVYADDEKTKAEIKKEGERYLRPNIFNNNDYNISAYDNIFGLHSNNMGLNDKKPYLDNKTRKESIPCAITMERAIVQNQFMEYLSSQAAKGNYNVYIDLDNKIIQCVPDKEKNKVAALESGLYFRIRQGKTEVEIYSLERINGYVGELKSPFHMKRIFEFEKKEEEYSSSYGTWYKLYQIEMIVHEGLFGKYLIGNYKTSAGDFPSSMDNLLKEQLLLCREQLWKWFYNNDNHNVQIVLDKACKRLIWDSIENGYTEKAKHQMNVWYSLTDYLNENRRKEESMSNVREQLVEHVIKTEKDWNFTSDDEYYYAVGQISRYILELSRKSKADKKLDMLKPIITVRNDKVLKERIVLLAKKYDYAIEMRYVRATELLAKVLTYMPKDQVNEVMIMAGYVDKNIVFLSKKKLDEEENKNEGL